jgi:hypothetical protein
MSKALSKNYSPLPLGEGLGVRAFCGTKPQSYTWTPAKYRKFDTILFYQNASRIELKIQKP